MKTWQINPMVVSTLTFFPKKVAEKQNLLADKLFMSAPLYILGNKYWFKSDQNNKQILLNSCSF